MSTYVKSKVVFAGDAAVGKTSIIYKYKDIKERVQATIVASSISCEVDYQDKKVTLNVWDTAGQDDYRVLVPVYARSAQIGVIVFDQTSIDSLEHVTEWYNFLSNASDIPYIVLVQNKIDLPPAEGVTDEHVKEIADKLGIGEHIYKTSAKDGQNIEILFYALAELVEKCESSNTPDDVVIFPTPPPNTSGSENETSGDTGKRCC